MYRPSHSSLSRNNSADTTKITSLLSLQESQQQDTQVDESISNMDRITQLQDAVDQLAVIFTTSVEYLQRRAPMAVVNTDFPITKLNELADEPTTFSRNTQELASDLIKKVKSMDLLINELPQMMDQNEEQLDEVFITLKTKNKEAANDLEIAVQKAEELLLTLKSTLRHITEAEAKRLQSSAVELSSANSRVHPTRGDSLSNVL